MRRQPLDWLNIPSGGTVVDVGSGPGDVTASLTHGVGPDGLVLGIDIAEPMLARAAKTHAGPRAELGEVGPFDAGQFRCVGHHGRRPGVTTLRARITD